MIVSDVPALKFQIIENACLYLYINVCLYVSVYMAKEKKMVSLQNDKWYTYM